MSLLNRSMYRVVLIKLIPTPLWLGTVANFLTNSVGFSVVFRRSVGGSVLFLLLFPVGFLVEVVEKCQEQSREEDVDVDAVSGGFATAEGNQDQNKRQDDHELKLENEQVTS